jgi:hypothetical protein
MNLAHGWCGVVAPRKFDHHTGGHLVLHELRLVIKFPAGSAALIPSTSITHSNVALQAGDKRASMTFYTGGGLFCFVNNAFCTLSSMTGTVPGEQTGKLPGEMILFSCWDELAGGR